MDTIVDDVATLRVHIAPVGFEIDRVVIPAKKMKADRVWLLVHNNASEDRGRPYAEKIKNQLKRSDVEVRTAEVNRLELFNIIKGVKKIIESEKDNDVYVNVASGSKIHSIACMMACMMFGKRRNVKPFYAEAEKYAAFEGMQQSSGVKKVMPLPSYEVQTPKPELVLALKLIKENGGKLRKKEMAELAERHKIIVVKAREENFEQARFASLDKNIIQPLEDHWSFVEVEKIGRNRWIKITEAGLQASEFLI
jgi:hypothetical protein